VDEARRIRLEERKRLAQLRRSRAAVSAAFRAVAPHLRTHGVTCSKLVPERGRAALGDLASGPGRDERLLWDHVAGAVCATWADVRERDALLRDALAACAAPDRRVAVVWHPYEAALRLRAGDLAAHAGPVLDAGGADTVWIVDAAGGDWLIEAAYWDRELCWSKFMPGARQALRGGDPGG
jgi:hypothetical protein